MEDIGTDGLLTKLTANIPADEGNPWNANLSAVGAWEYGKPAVQPVLNRQTPLQNAPAYTITIPEKVELERKVDAADGTVTYERDADNRRECAACGGGNHPGDPDRRFYA